MNLSSQLFRLEKAFGKEGAQFANLESYKAQFQKIVKLNDDG